MFVVYLYLGWNVIDEVYISRDSFINDGFEFGFLVFNDIGGVGGKLVGV